tara:strand:+ start:440 stop:559 length:120 start_codon:yes stop_codon:yes gene_type:complete
MLIKNLIKGAIILISLLALVSVVETSVKQKLERNYELNH